MEFSHPRTIHYLNNTSSPFPSLYLNRLRAIKHPSRSPRVFFSTTPDPSLSWITRVGSSLLNIKIIAHNPCLLASLPHLSHFIPFFIIIFNTSCCHFSLFITITPSPALPLTPLHHNFSTTSPFLPPSPPSFSTIPSLH
jgi:hypothetical protein